MQFDNQVAVYRDPRVIYPTEPPFHPEQSYPEYVFGAGHVGPGPNPVYAAVRETLRLLGLDRERYGTPEWNPLGDLVRPGDRVTLKPNFVLHFNSTDNDLQAVVTHGSVLRPVLDYVIKALDGRGRVTVGDAPHGNADFARIVEFTGVERVVEFVRSRGAEIDLVDFRQYRYGHGPEGFLKETRTRLDGDPRGYTVVDLGRSSELADLDALERLYGADYDRSIIRRHHNERVHEYLVANSVLESDVVIGLPKLKVHSKAGVTINLKNLVGINGDKNWLPHYRIGDPTRGGDEFPRSPLALENVLRRLDRAIVERLLGRDTRLRKRAYRAFLRFYYPALDRLTARSNNRVHLGNWSGNDTVWRMVLDLNKILLYADASGVLRDRPQRRFLSIVDGVIGGEGQGPLGPTAVRCGVLLGGSSPLLVDLVGARLIGLDPGRVPLLCNAFRDEVHRLSPVPLEQAVIRTNRPELERLATEAGPYLGFELPFGWREQPASSPAPAASGIDETALHP